MFTELPIIEAFLLGLLSSIHCGSMCGGLAIALQLLYQRSETKSGYASYVIQIQMGRITTYALLGLCLGLGASWLDLELYSSFTIGLRIFAGLLIVLMGIQLAGWTQKVAVLDILISKVWRSNNPLNQWLQRFNEKGATLLLGLAWGLLPCGLIYTLLIWSFAQTADWKASLLMLSFGIGTLPAIIFICLMGGKLMKILQHKWLRSSLGLLIIFFGILTALVPLQHQGHEHGHSTHHH